MTVLLSAWCPGGRTMAMPVVASFLQTKGSPGSREEKGVSLMHSLLLQGCSETQECDAD